MGFRGLILVWILAVALWAGDSARGQIFYAHLLGPQLEYNGAVFTKLYTQVEWEALFADRAEGFIDRFGPKMDETTQTMLRSDHFYERILPHLRAFAIEYAADQPGMPMCADDEPE